MSINVKKILDLKTKPIFIFVGINVIFFVFMFTLFTQAQWLSPSTVPPGGNASPPVNTSGVWQFKEGGITLGNNSAASVSLWARNGRVGLGNGFDPVAAPIEPLDRFIVQDGGNILLQDDDAKDAGDIVFRESNSLGGDQLGRIWSAPSVGLNFSSGDTDQDININSDGNATIGNSLPVAVGTTRLTVQHAEDGMLRLLRVGAASPANFRMGTDSALVINSGGADSARFLGGSVRFPGLVNCNTIDTDALGNLTCGSDETSAGGSGIEIAGSLGQTLYHNGTDWAATSNIYNNGTNVGIGITTPTDRLDVNGGITTRGGTLNINRPNTTGGWARGVHFDTTDGSTRLGGIGLLGSDVNTVRFYMAVGASPWASGQGLYVRTSDGNVGVKVLNPTHALEVNGNARIGTGATSGDIFKVYGGGNIVLQDDVGADPGDIVFRNSAGAELATIWSSPSFGLNFSSGNAGVQDINIDANGNVTVGNDLGVAGTTRFIVQHNQDNIAQLIRTSATSPVNFRVGTDSALVINSNGADSARFLGGSVRLPGYTGGGTGCSALETDGAGNVVCGVDDISSGGSGINIAGSLGQTLYHNGTDWAATSFLSNTGSGIGIGTLNPSAPLDIAVTGETAIEFDNGDSIITVHDGFGNFNFKSGVNDDNIITKVAGGSHLRMDENGAIIMSIDESTVVGGTFSSSLSFSMNAGEFIFTGGRVGIGTSAPAEALHVAGSIQTSNAFIGTGGHGAAYMHVSHPNYKGAGQYALLQHESAGHTYLNSVGTGNIYFRNDNGDRMTLTDTGNLSVVGDVTVSGNNLNFGAGEDIIAGTNLLIRSNSGFLDLRSSDATHGLIIRDFDGGSTGWGGIRQVNADRLEFSVGGGYGSSLVIKDNNNVGIGFTNPQVTLEVNSVVRARGNTASEYAEIGHGGANAYINWTGNGDLDFRRDGTNRMSLKQSGRLILNPDGAANGIEINAINTTCSGCSLRLYENDIHFTRSGTAYIRSGGDIVFQSYGGAWRTLRAGAFLYGSDANLKKDITPIEGALSKILQLEGVSYRWKSDNRLDVGVIAQDVEKVFPEVVSESEDGTKMVDYGHLVGPLIEAIKEQQTQIEDLEARIQALEEKLE